MHVQTAFDGHRTLEYRGREGQRLAFGVSRLEFRVWRSALRFRISFRVSRFAFGFLRFVSRFALRVWRFVSRFALRVSLSLDPTHQEGGVWDSARASEEVRSQWRFVYIFWKLRVPWKDRLITF